MWTAPPVRWRQRYEGHTLPARALSGPTLNRSTPTTFFPRLTFSIDAVRVCGPEERLGKFVCLREEAVDGRLEIGNPPEDTALEPLARQLSKVKPSTALIKEAEVVG